jgi:hypothetical protein
MISDPEAMFSRRNDYSYFGKQDGMKQCYLLELLRNHQGALSFWVIPLKYIKKKSIKIERIKNAKGRLCLYISHF